MTPTSLWLAPALGMASTDFVDPYLDPETGLLRNLVGARSDAELVAAEGALVFTRAVQLLDHPPRPTGDLAELKAIHRHLFQDLFDWAGQIRSVDIRKNAEGSEFFMPVSLIERGSRFVAEQMHAVNDLERMTRDQFIERLVQRYDEVRQDRIGGISMPGQQRRPSADDPAVSASLIEPGNVTPCCAGDRVRRPVFVGAMEPQTYAIDTTTMVVAATPRTGRTRLRMVILRSLRCAVGTVVPRLPGEPGKTRQPRPALHVHGPFGLHVTVQPRTDAGGAGAVSR